MNKKTILTMILTGFLGLTQAQNTNTSSEHVKSATAIKATHSCPRQCQQSAGRRAKSNNRCFGIRLAHQQQEPLDR